MNDPQPIGDRNTSMYFRNLHRNLSVLVIMMLSLLLSSCEAVVDVFKAGMSFGIFIVAAIIIAIIVLLMRTGKNKSPNK